MRDHKSKGPTEVRPDLSLRRIAIFCTQRPSEEGLEPDAGTEREGLIVEAGHPKAQGKAKEKA